MLKKNLGVMCVEEISFSGKLRSMEIPKEDLGCPYDNGGEKTMNVGIDNNKSLSRLCTEHLSFWG